MCRRWTIRAITSGKGDALYTLPNYCDYYYYYDCLLIDCSRAIMTYLVSAYAVDDKLYPMTDVKLRSLIDQRLQFDLGTLYARTADHFVNYSFNSNRLFADTLLNSN